jgi:hypothetical protein
MAKRLEIKEGTKIGKLTVLREGEKLRLPSGQLNRTIICKCECGNEKQIRLLHLIRGRISSCGCLGGIHHGESKTRLYKLWRAIKYRCYISPYFNGYIDKNITVCDDWQNNYLSFREWALNNGFDEKLQIDRISNNLGYSPDNCRFVTNIENVNNRSNTFLVNYHGSNIPFMNLIHSKKMLVHESAIRSRIKRGWDADRAFDFPVRNGNYIKKVHTEEEAVRRWFDNNRKKHTPKEINKRCTIR